MTDRTEPTVVSLIGDLDADYHDLFIAAARLAEASEFNLELEREDAEWREALDNVWALVDSSGGIRRAAKRRKGCCQCGGTLESADDDLCADCAAKTSTFVNPFLEPPR